MIKFVRYILVIMIMVMAAGCGGKAVKPPEMAAVTRGAIKAQTPTTGLVEPRNRLEIKPPVSGRIESVLVAEGQNVKKGKTLAMMSSSDRAALLDAARSKSAAEYKQWEQVYKPAPIVAPLDGFVIQKNIEPGQTVTAQDSVLVMADILIVKAQVDETDIGNIKIGQPVTIQLDAYPDQTIKGKVEHIAYESTVVSNVTIYRVDVVPEEVPAFFRSGMSATINFIREEKSDVLLLPIKAVKKVGTISYAFQYDAATKTGKPIQIKTGLENTSHIEIVSGLKEKDKVAIPDKKMITELESRSNRMRGPMNPFQKKELMSLIELKEVHKTYYIGGKIPVNALQGISVSIEPGEFVAIMGPSGSGKSTLLAVLGLLDKSDKGEYWLLNKNISSMQESDYARLRNRFFGFVFQTFNLLAKLTVTENAMLPFIYSSGATKEKKDKVLETLKNIGLGDRLKHKSNELSGGQQQRVALGRALANEPIVILADEPTGNLDSRSSYEIMKIFNDLNAAGNTIIMVTHEPDIAAYASRVLHLQDGKIVSDKKQKETAKVEVPELPVENDRGRCRLLCFAELRNYVLEALSSIANNKLRSFLSILGVMIGVAAVITMLALGTGAKMSMEKTLSSLGTNLLTVRAQRNVGGISLGLDTPTRFTFEDLAALEKIDGIQYVVPYVQGRGQAVFQSNNWNTSIVGASSDYPLLRDIKLDSGRFFTLSEANSRAKVAVIGQTVADNLFAGQNAVGQFIKINKINFTVIGVLQRQGASGFQNPDDRILIPIKTAMYRLLGTDYISYFEVRAKNREDMADTQDSIVSELMRLHKLNESQKQSIDVMNMADIQAAASSVITTLSLLLGVIAAVSLLVGGIGIMNIMLVMVMERTHEIGLRKALGAQRSDILIQFLIEAVLICFLGGVIGIIFGSLISFLLSTLANWTTHISSGSIILSFTFSVVIGIIFGLWPAIRASKMLPIEALRYE